VPLLHGFANVAHTKSARGAAQDPQTGIVEPGKIFLFECNPCEEAEKEAHSPPEERGNAAAALISHAASEHTDS